MDNLCHTLAGAALGEAGLKTRTRFGNPALMIASNLPDIDVLAFATSTPAVAIRRGWTHGILAQLLLPIAFTGVLMLWARWSPRRRANDPPARAGTLLAIAYLGVISHVLMDLLNNYGVRVLMPFSHRWFYGDAVFIVDPWLWTMLAGGVWLARRTRRTRPARAALTLAVVYILAMVVSARAARRIVLETWAQLHATAPQGLMVGPAPVSPFRKAIILDAGDHYETGEFDWRGRVVRFDPERLPRRDDDPLVLRAREDRRVRAVLVWARFPVYQIDLVPEGTRVTISDLRFGARVGRVSVVVAEK